MNHFTTHYTSIRFNLFHFVYPKAAKKNKRKLFAPYPPTSLQLFYTLLTGRYLNGT